MTPSCNYPDPSMMDIAIEGLDGCGFYPWLLWAQPPPHCLKGLDSCYGTEKDIRNVIRVASHVKPFARE
jgi:hypothetical protein